MIKFVKSLLLPDKDNMFLPKIIGYKALVFYGFISVIIFAALSPVFIQKDRLLAYLTQDLIIQEVNPIRLDQGFLALEINDKLTMAAQLKAEDMVKRDYFDHFGPDGEQPWSWLKKVDYNYAVAAENLAIDAQDPKALVDAWLASPSHAKNILNGYFTDVGMGMANGYLQGRETTIVVMFLGKEIPKDIIVSRVASDDIDKNTPVQEPILTQNDIGINTDLPAPELTKLPAEKSFTQKIDAEIFLINKFPFWARFGLTIFFNIIILWTLATFLINREKFWARAFNSLIVLSLLFFIWLPEIA